MKNEHCNSSSRRSRMNNSIYLEWYSKVFFIMLFTTINGMQYNTRPGVSVKRSLNVAAADSIGGNEINVNFYFQEKIVFIILPLLHHFSLHT